VSDLARPVELTRVAGEGVLLRPVRASDAPRVYELVGGNHDILRWLVWEGPESIADLEGRFEHWARPAKDAVDYLFAVAERAAPDATDEPLVGTLGLRCSGHAGMADVGYWIGQPYWGRGYATEAIGLATWLAFRHLGAHTVSASVFVGNDASRRALERNGFRLTHTGPARQDTPGRSVTEWVLTRIRTGWEADPERREPTAEDVRPAP
jgi:RimJ/RimL family protein N-acetyltransferase